MATAFDPARGVPQPEDHDPEETREWLEALRAVVETGGEARGRFLLKALEEQAQQLGVVSRVPPYSAYRNSIALEHQQAHPGDVELEERLVALIRWNALAMVVRANRANGALGGHIASFASAAEIFETGFNHFFRAGEDGRPGDLVFLQPHSAPGVYARAFLEGRLTETQLAHYRRECGGDGLSSYPHPWLMPEFWQFPTGSMGIGPINAIYQARFLRYLRDRGLAETDHRHVWGLFGDGEMDEPESLAGLTLAARENLDNLTFVINCNLQRLDGPVRGNGQIIQELESLFSGAGWNVIKVLWGSDWDPLFARDKHHRLLRALAATVDGEYQTLGAKDGLYNREHFFARDPGLQALVKHMSAAEIDALRRGGHDLRKLYAAYAAAYANEGAPTVILAKTKKGFGMGGAGESRMTSHQQKKLDLPALKLYCERFHLPMSDDEIADVAFYRPPEDGPEIRYLKERRAALGGTLPVRRPDIDALPVPALEKVAAFALDAQGKAMSTTVAFVRMLGGWLKDATLGPRVVPIVADEARTFGMAGLFKQIGIYSSVGQRYEPEDAGSLLSYRESQDGQLLEEGINEAGALSSWVAAATAYSAHDIALLPFYIYYSMFGFQRVGDLIWAAADQRARGFLLGATAGRTTLNGEGLQHQDGSSHLAAATIPNCRAYDPGYAYEVAVIVDHGARAMLEAREDVFYYVTLMNESYPQPSLPDGVADAIIHGLYPLPDQPDDASVRLLGSGALLPEVAAAAELLRDEWDVPAAVFSATSYSELAREAAASQRAGRLRRAAPESHLARMLPGDAPVVAVTDYVRAVPSMIAPYLSAPMTVLGTDGFGRSDTRPALRRWFEVDRHHVVVAALAALGDERRAADAVTRYELDADATPPWMR